MHVKILMLDAAFSLDLISVNCQHPEFAIFCMHFAPVPVCMQYTVSKKTSHPVYASAPPRKTRSSKMC